MTDDNVRPHGTPGDSTPVRGAFSNDPGDNAEIAALLASLDSPATPAMPPEVTARLDAVIAEETRARREAPRHDLRKLVVAWGAAAAAVVAVVAGVSVVADNFGIGSGSSSDSQVSADSKALSSAPESGGQAAIRPVVHAHRLARDARELVASPTAGRVIAPDNAADLGCPAPREPRPDRLVMAVDYEGPDGEARAILIVTTEPPRTATVFACDGTRLQQVPLD